MKMESNTEEGCIMAEVPIKHIERRMQLIKLHPIIKEKLDILITKYEDKYGIFCSYSDYIGILIKGDKT
jgi:hypothetical protein